MLSKSDIGQLLSDQVSEYITTNGRRIQPLIEADPYDDAEGDGFDPLNRWGDRRFKLQASRWS